MEERKNWNIMGPYDGPERRVYKRIRKRFLSKFQIRPGDAREDISAGWDMVTIYNLGAGGALFNYDKKLEIGSLLNLVINFPQAETPVSCVARTLRIEEPPMTVMLRIAVVFIAIDEKDKEIINNAAEEFYSRKPGLLEP